MKKKKSILFTILLMAVGFAAVATNLFINGSTVIGTNSNEFEIIFSKALLDNENKTNEIISGDKKTITFTTKELKDIGDKSVLTYDVTNLSNQYDANVTINVDVETNEYIKVTNDFDTTNMLLSRETRTGELTVELIKAATENLEYSLTVELEFSAVERLSIGTGDLPDDEVESLTFYDTNNQVLQNKNVTIDGTSYTTNNEGKVSNLSLNPYISHTLVIYPNNNEEYLSCSAPLYKDFDCDGLPIHSSLNSFYVPNANLEIGDVLRIDTEDFYYIGNDASGNYKFLTKYNLNVTNNNNLAPTEYGLEGMQNSKAKGFLYGDTESTYGTISFINSDGSSVGFGDVGYSTNYWETWDYAPSGAYCRMDDENPEADHECTSNHFLKSKYGNATEYNYTDSIHTSNSAYYDNETDQIVYPYVYDENSVIYNKVESYVTSLKSLNNLVLSAKLPSKEELGSLGCNVEFASNYFNFTGCDTTENINLGRNWLWSTAYWTGSVLNHYQVLSVYRNGAYSYNGNTTNNSSLGVRPVVTISKRAVFTGEGTEETPYTITYSN